MRPSCCRRLLQTKTDETTSATKTIEITTPTMTPVESGESFLGGGFVVALMYCPVAITFLLLSNPRCRSWYSVPALSSPFVMCLSTKKEAIPT